MNAETLGSDSAATVKLVALTAEARDALGGAWEVFITRFPFKIGRQSRSRSMRALEFLERRLGIPMPTNDLYLYDGLLSDVLQISREHCAIERVGDAYMMSDLGSTCGTIVAGQQVGGHRTGGQTELRDGAVIVIGNASSPYVFRFQLGKDAWR